MKLSRGSRAYDTICESAQDDEGCNASFGLFGSAYVATAGVPLEEKVERALLPYVFDEEQEASVFDLHEVEAYVGRRARVLLSYGATLVGTIKKSGGIVLPSPGKGLHVMFALRHRQG